MNKENFRKQLARLESLNDHLETELTSLDVLLKAVGFEKGLYTVKLASIDVLNEICPDFEDKSVDKCESDHISKVDESDEDRKEV